MTAALPLVALALLLGAAQRRPGPPAKAETPRARAERTAREAVERYRRDGDLAAAQGALRAAAALDPACAAPRCDLGAVLLDRDEWAGARPELEACARLAAGTRRATLAVLAIERVDWFLAVPEAKRRALRYAELVAAARASPPLAPSALLALAARAERVDPTRWEVPTLAGVSLGKARRWSDCAALLERAAARRPEAVRAPVADAARECREEAEHARLVAEGRSAVKARDAPRAGAALHAAWKLRPDRLDDALVAAQALSAAGDEVRALELLRALAARGNPRDREAAAAVLAALAAQRPVVAPGGDP